MYAVVRVGGQQLRVEPNETVLVPRLNAEVGDTLTLGEVLAVSDGNALTVGTPVVEGAKVEAEVLGHPRGAKIKVFKFKRRKDYRRHQGHRQALTQVKIQAW